MTTRRSRIGSASADWRPNISAAWAKIGPRAPSELIDRLGHAGFEAVAGRALRRLLLEQFKHCAVLTRRRDDPKPAALVREQDASGVDVQQGDAPRGERRQHVDDVELVDEVVGQFDKRVDEELLTIHDASEPLARQPETPTQLRL